MGNEKEEIAKNVVETLIPKVESTIKALIDGDFTTKLPQLKEALQHELWDKACEEIGKQMKIPAEIIHKLQIIDDVVKANKDGVEKTLKDMIEKVESFKDRLKGIDLTKTVTMSYKELQNERVKSGLSWGLLTFILGFLAGIVFIISNLKLLN